MIFDKKGNNITVATQESGSLLTFLSRFKESYAKIKNDNIVVNLFSLGKLTGDDVLEFLEISNKHRAENKSFVIVTNKVNYDEIPDELEIVPTLQEAFDIIDMEEIERDLEFGE
ncbi:ribonuclease Z [Abyssalbus ytuae]|uniref:Ribonuclease Z n=1 Tax=Abyssalbus ytuae TaxID=2926907 RepID=A0A9E6ZMT7_9FLAO|nr:ribonuclease Z [Abyssalbus ytuae]UOB17225.1 ribonuclease Z [Abyssalbus ytuae]